MTSATTVMTVLGAVPAEQLGFTLPHEHLLCQTVREYRGAGQLDDESLAVEELISFADAGGGALVDLTTDEIGRDPNALSRISQATGVHIVMGSGHYRDPYLDREWFDRHDVGAIADEIVKDATAGVGDSDVRSGIIGEIGTNDRYISAAEERSFRGAGRAHHRTGLSISTHAAWWPVGLAQLDLLEQESVPADRVIIGHVDTVADPDYPLALARRGCWVQFDGFGTDAPHDQDRAMRRIKALAECGHLNQILISHDVFLRPHLHAYGGGGYTYIADSVVDQLSAEGFAANEIRQLTYDNPQRALYGPPR
jgi:predicted metal-dependent phosphotriesterase family hydrolase